MDIATIRTYLQQHAAHSLNREESARLLEALRRLSPADLDELFPHDEWKNIEPLLISRAQMQTGFQALQGRIDGGRRKVRRMQLWWSSAAAVVLIAGGLIWMNRSLPETILEPAAIAWQEITTARGQQKQVRLSDGTLLHLNGGTRLQVPATFTDQQRMVKLMQGEVFLTVQKEAGRSFLLMTGQVLVEVLGAAFNVRNYAAENSIVVTLREGLIAVGLSDSSKVTLRPGEQYLQETGKAMAQVRPVPVHSIGQWHTGELVFEDATLKEIFKELEPLYGYTFIAPEALLQQRFRVSFRRRDLKAIMRQLSTMGSFTYQIKDHIVTLQ